MAVEKWRPRIKPKGGPCVPRNWTFGKKIFTGFFIAGLILLLVALVGYQSTHQLIENQRWVRHSYQVRRKAADLLSLMKDAETGQRGFVLTGEESYLEPYAAARESVKATLEELRQQTVDNSEQQGRLTGIAGKIEDKMGELKETIELRRRQGLEAALKVVNSGRGKAFMDQIRRDIQEFDDQENILLERRRQSAESSAQMTKLVLLWGSVGGALLVTLVGWSITVSASRQIGNSVAQVQSSAAELQAISNQQATGSKEQSSAMNEIATTINELLATSRQIAESAQQVARIAQQTLLCARNGSRVVEVSRDSMGSIQRQVGTIVTNMLDLGRKSQQIGTVLDIVSELAEQTNILAINATIEAAGAGEAGKRFGVVAEEIRKLADRVTTSSKEIRGLIDDVRSGVNTTVMSTETGSKAVDAGLAQFANVTSAFEEIAGLVNTSDEASREIELSTKQQSTAVEQVNLATLSVAQAAREMESSSAQTLQTASQLSALSTELSRMIRQQ